MRKLQFLPLLALVLFSCQPKDGDKTTQDSTTEPKAKTVKVAPLTLQTVTVSESYTATINPFDKVYLAPNIPGRIKNVKVEVNDRVRKGQVIVEMDDTQLTQLEVQYNNLKKEMVRMDALIEHGSVSQQVYDQTKSQYDATKANYENLKENTKLVSPFNGVITDKFFENNELYSAAPNTQAGKAAIVTIEQINKLKVTINVSERHFPKIKPGLQAELTSDIYPDRKFTGEVSLVYPTIDPQTRTFKVEISIKNDELELRPGMFSRLKLNLGEKTAIMVPSATVMMLTGTSERYIYVVKDNKAQMVKVSLGERFDDKLEIISPNIKEGDLLVISGQTKLETGDLVEIVK